MPKVFRSSPRFHLAVASMSLVVANANNLVSELSFSLYFIWFLVSDVGIEFDEDDIREVKRARPLPIFSFDLETAE